MHALLMSSALATALAGVVQPGTANAACVTGGPVLDPTSVACSGTSAGTTVITGNSISVTTAADTVIDAVNPLAVIVGSGLGGGDITLNDMGGSFTATGDGVVLSASGAIRQADGTAFGATVSAAGYGLLLLPTTTASLVANGATNVTAGASAVLASAPGGVTISATGGVFQGTNGDGLTLLSSSDILVRNFAGAAGGGQNGIFAQTAGNIDLSGFSGSATGAAANGIHAQSTTTGGVDLSNFAGSASGAQYGVFAQTVTGAITLTGFAGTATGTAADGIFAQTAGPITADGFAAPAAGAAPHISGAVNGMALLSGSGGISVQNFASSASGGQYGIFVQTAGGVNLSGFSGAAAGTGASGIFARGESGGVTADNFAAPAGAAGPHITGGVAGMMLLSADGSISAQNFASAATGGQYGIFAQNTTIGTINVSGFSGTAEGTADSGIFLQSRNGSIDAGNFAAGAVVKGGQNGLIAVATVAGNVDVNGFAGSAEGTTLAGIRAGTASGNVNVNNFSGTASGGTYGLLLATENGDLNLAGFTGTARGTGADADGINGAATGTISVATAGNADISGTGNGISLRQAGGNVGVNLAGSTKVAGGVAGVRVNSDAPSTGNVTIETGAGTSVSGDTGGGIRVTKESVGGQVGITAHGSVGSAGAAGIVVDSTIDQATTTTIVTTGAVSGATGGILASTTSRQGNAVSDISTLGAVNGGTGTAVRGTATADAAANATSSVQLRGAITGGAFGIAASATAGNVATTEVRVENTVAVTNSGVVASAQGGSGAVTVTTAGTGAIAAQTGTGIQASAAGNGFRVGIITNAEVQAGGRGLYAGITGDDGTVEVATHAKITSNGDGIYAGINGTGGTVTVTNTAGIASAGSGIYAENTGGDTTVNVDAKISSQGLYGAAAVAGGTGNATLNVNAVIDPPFIGGLVATTGSGTATANVDAEVQATGAGISASNAGTGAIDVNVNAGGTIRSDGFGILAAKTGDGATTIDVDAAVGGLTGAATGFAGILATADGNAPITITTTANGTISATGNGIAVDHAGGGDIGIVTGGAITARGEGIQVLTAANTGGNVMVNTGAAITARGNGISIAKTGDGDTRVQADANISSATGVGIIAVNATGTGTVTVNTGAGTRIRGAQAGVVALNLTAGAGNTTAVNIGSASRVVSYGAGVVAGGLGDVAVTTQDGARILADRGMSGAGSAIQILAADTAAVNIGAGSLISGAGKGWDSAVIAVASNTSSAVTIGRGALVSSWSFTSPARNLVAAASDIAIDADGGAAAIANAGTVIGRIGLTDGNDILGNLGTGRWVTTGTSAFGAGTDQVFNSGAVVTALQAAVAETTAFTGLEWFVNGDPAGTGRGLLTMIDGEAPGDIAFNGQRDVTYVSGVFVGQGNSRVGVDAYLGAAGSTSDVLRIGGLDAAGNQLPAGTLATQGQTALIVNDVNAGPGAYNPQGILVVDVVNPDAVTTGKGDPNTPASFVISSASASYDARYGGVIDKGLFIYDVAVRGNDTYLVGVPDQEVFELPKLVTGAQSIWHETTGVWLDRQADLRTYINSYTAQAVVTRDGVYEAPVAVQRSVTPGIWGKAVGSWGSRDASDSFAVANRVYGFDTGYNQDTYGFIAGADIGKEGVTAAGDAVMLGVLGGYVTSDLTFDASPTSATYSGGTVGGYATYLNQNWFLNALLKADFLSMDYKAPTLVSAGYFGQSVDVTNVGFSLDTGYRFKWGASSFFEPVATLNYVSTKIDDLPLMPGTVVDFGSNDSLRAGLGARVGGRVLDTSSFWMEGSLTGRLWYEFLADNSVALFNPGLPIAMADPFDGAFGEFGVGLNMFGKTSGWNGFTNASVKFGNDYTSGNAQGGARLRCLGSGGGPLMMIARIIAAMQPWMPPAGIAGAGRIGPTGPARPL